MIEWTDLRPAPRRLAFTLVELLVVIVIIGILVSLLLPAVQAARESARRTQCTNNLHQLGIGLAAYESANNIFPPGARWYGDNNGGNRGNILMTILPFIEQLMIYEQFDFSKVTDGQTFGSSTRMIGATIIPTYVCPSDLNSDLYNGRACANYAASNGPSAQINSSACSCPNYGDWNQFALAPYCNPDDYAGPFMRSGVIATRRGVTTAVEVRDGLSNTIFFGETRRGCSGHEAAGWAWSNDGNGLVATLYPINYDSCHADPSPDGCSQPRNWNTELGFKSRHPGGAQFLFGDGAVHFLEQSIDHWTYQYLGAKADGQTVAVP
jgi:prepilin-type N-terminal cleavage/methylation domain-containing protein/prepilin-type processing-associated H-X9-DG protein